MACKSITLYCNLWCTCHCDLCVLSCAQNLHILSLAHADICHRSFGTLLGLVRVVTSYTHSLRAMCSAKPDAIVTDFLQRCAVACLRSVGKC